MRILGIDPGLTRCGVGVIESHPNRTASLVEVGVLTSSPDEAIEQRLKRIGDGIGELLDRLTPDVVALERVFAQLNLSTVMGVAQISGVVMFQAASRGVAVALHTPSEVKAAVTGYGSADKAQVGAMVARILRLASVPKPADAADALALAICHAWRGRTPSVPAAELTPAQNAWRAAESAAKHGRTLGR